jgi:hypothetical protein
MENDKGLLRVICDEYANDIISGVLGSMPAFPGVTTKRCSYGNTLSFHLNHTSWVIWVWFFAGYADVVVNKGTSPATGRDRVGYEDPNFAGAIVALIVRYFGEWNK